MPLPSPPNEWAEVDYTWGLYWWMEVDWTPLLDGAQLKGADTDISHAPGRYVNSRQIDETEYVCPGYLYSDRSFDGDEVSGFTACRSNMRANLSFLRGYVCSPPRPASPLRTFTLHDQYGDDWGADVIIDRHLSLTPVVGDSEQSPLMFKVVFRVIVPAGELMTVGS